MAVAVGLFAANMLAVAVAEAPTVTPTRTLAVQGVANIPIGQDDDATTATAVYREASAAAVADGQSKASFLASKVGAALVQVQTVTEDGGYIECTAIGEASYAEYEGEQPDFGNAPQLVGTAAPAATATPRSRRTAAVAPAAAPKAKRKKRKHTTAKQATAGNCKLYAQVSLVYAIG
jgi:uncharacterized protein YggE